MTRRRLIAGNWKMNKSPAETAAFLDAFLPRLPEAPDVEVLLIPPYTSLECAGQRLSGSPVVLAGQDLHFAPAGAYTGAISASMLIACGCRYVLVGHSERRQLFGEDDELIRRKLEAAVSEGLRPILCVGETLEERRGGKTDQVIMRQLSSALCGIQEEAIQEAVVAYEPVWAIGTGETPTAAQTQETCARIRSWLAGRFGDRAAQSARILYGGSVKEENASELVGLPDVDGALVGGASLEPGPFAAIVREGARGGDER